MHLQKSKLIINRKHKLYAAIQNIYFHYIEHVSIFLRFDNINSALPNIVMSKNSSSFNGFILPSYHAFAVIITAAMMILIIIPRQLCESVLEQNAHCTRSNSKRAIL